MLKLSKNGLRLVIGNVIQPLSPFSHRRTQSEELAMRLIMRARASPMLDNPVKLHIDQNAEGNPGAARAGGVFSVVCWESMGGFISNVAVRSLICRVFKWE